MSQMTAEDRVVVDTCRAHIFRVPPSVGVELVTGSGIDWAGVMAIGAQNRVVAPLTRYLLPRDDISKEVKRTLVNTSLRLYVEAKNVAERFEAALPSILERQNIIALRGIAFWYTHRLQRFSRPIGDIDLLIERPEVPSLSGLLNDHHHVPSKASASKTGVIIEYHHDFNLHNGFRITRIDMAGLRNRRRIIVIQEREVGLLSEEDSFIYLCDHNVRKGFVKLYRLVDLATLARIGQCDWAIVVQRARQFGVARAVWLNCHALSILFGEVIPAWVLKELSPRGFIRWLMIRLFSPRLVLHDPNPKLRGRDASLRWNCRKKLLLLFATANRDNWYKLALGVPVSLFVTAYARLFRLRTIGPLLMRARNAFQSRWMGA